METLQAARPAEIMTHTGQASDLDRLARIAAALCSTPISFVAAFDDSTQWFRARVGFDIESTARGDAICGTVFEAGRDVVIPDLLADARTCCNPIVLQMGLRFYAGHPIVDADGVIVGTICVLDTQPRSCGLKPTETVGMAALAEQASTFLHMRRRDASREIALESHELRERHDRHRITRLSALVNLGDRLRDVGTPAEAFEVAAEILGITLDAQQAGCGQVDIDNRCVIVENDWSREGIPSSNGIHEFTDHSDILAEMQAGRTMVAIDPMVNDPSLHSHMRVPALLRGRLVGMVYVIDGPDRHWTADDMEFARGVADRVHGAVERLVAQEERDILVGEIGHRMKNLMSVTRAIAMQTLAGRADRDVIKDLDERLSAYSGAHDLLLTGGVGSAHISDTAETVLRRLSVDDRVDMSGDDIELDERATLSLALLVNELATNAIKHGSLSRGQGRVKLEWRVDGDTLILEWTEFGGPPASAPTRRGFGSRILEIGLHRPGGTTLDYSEKGLRACFRAPLDLITAP